MKSYKNYVDVLRNISKNFSESDEFDDIIKYILINLFDTYYLERDTQLYNIDNVFKKYSMNMYNLLSKKYVLTKSKKLIFIKHKYDKREYIINLLKKNKNLILEDDRSYKSVYDEILKSDIDCYTKYVNDFCHDRLLNKKRKLLFVSIPHVILQNSKVHMYNYLYKIYPKLFKDYKVLYMDTDCIYANFNMTHEEYIEILENNKDVFGKNKGQMEPEHLHNPIQEGVFLSSKSYSYICKNDIPDNKHKMKNNMLHTKSILNSYSQQYIDHNLFKETLLNNDKPGKISFNTISVKNQQISTNKITKNNIEFLNDKRYIKDINSNVPHTLYV